MTIAATLVILFGIFLFSYSSVNIFGACLSRNSNVTITYSSENVRSSAIGLVCIAAGIFQHCGLLF